MKGDFSRSTFKRKNGFSSVLMQQGRVLLDADFNEQSAIVLHYLRTLASDLIGPHDDKKYDTYFRHGGTGFEVKVKKDGNRGEFTLSEGNYYVKGILCENTSSSPLDPQPKGQDGEHLDQNLAHLLYLDVWERLITAIEEPSIVEVALGAEDTCVRSKVEWRLKSLAISRAKAGKAGRGLNQIFPNVSEALNSLKSLRSTALMSARLEPGDNIPDPCIQPPASAYRGQENQLYRVEIHTGGDGDHATFKWSRENGSVTFPIVSFENNNSVVLEHLGRDPRSGLRIGDIVELLGEDQVINGTTNSLMKVDKINYDSYGIDLARIPNTNDVPPTLTLGSYPQLRRWDHHPADKALEVAKTDGAFKVQPGRYHTLENGIQIRFALGDKARYNVGDYWLITARTNGTIDWPENADPVRAFGIRHYYAPLAVVEFDPNAIVVKKEYGGLQLYNPIYNPPKDK